MKKNLLLLLIGVAILFGSMCFFQAFLPKTAWAMTYYWGRHPTKERLVFLFQGELPSYSVQRIDRTTLKLTFPANIWTVETAPSPIDLSSTKIIKAIILIKNEFYIQTRTAAFGFVHFDLKNPAKLVIDFFKDKLGSQWTPQNATSLSSKKTENQKAKQEPAATAKKAALSPEISSQPVSEKTTSPRLSSKTEIARQDNSRANSLRTSRNGSQVSGQIVVEKISSGQKAVSTVQIPPQSRQKDRPMRAPTNKQDQQAGTLQEIKDVGSLAALSDTAKPSPQKTQEEPPNVLRAKIALLGPDKARPLRPSVVPEARQGVLPQEAINTAQTEKKPITNIPASRSPETPQPGQPAQEISGQIQTAQTTQPAQDKGKQTAQTEAAPPQGNNATTQNATQPDYKGQVVQGETALANGQIESAKEIFALLAKDPSLPEKLRDTVLYALADSYFQLYQGKFQEHYTEITDAYEEAVNFNPKSMEAPLALLRLFLVNLKVGNIPEAKGYFKLLLKQYPGYPQIPTAYYYWGEYYEQHKDYQQAVKNYQHLIEKYPESPVTKNAAIGLARTLSRMEFYAQAGKIIQYISKRWPRAYIKEPEILKLSGFVAMKNKEYEKAKDYYWQYFNIVPDDKTNDLTLAHIGDLNLYLNQKQAAKKIYQKVIQMYPDTEGAMIAKMRLAEEGVHDRPRVVEMFSVFDRPFNLRPVKVYTEIIQKHPKSPLAPLAQLKLAMWYLWEENYPKTLLTAQEFRKKFPKSTLLPRAMEVGAAALSKLIKLAVQDNNFPRVMELWKKYKNFHLLIKDDETLLGVALSAWKTGQIDLALQLAKPYLLAKKFNRASYTALELILNIQVSNQNWPEVLKLSNRLAKHKIPPNLKAQLDFSRALAYENLGQKEKSINLWQQLIGNKHLTKKQRGYAYYFLAKQAMESGNLQTGYIFAQAAFEDLWQTRSKEDSLTVLDTLDILVTSTEKSGRLLDALQWALKYEQVIDPSSPEWTSYRYKLAQLYRKAGDLEKWKNILKSLEKQFPKDHFAKLASTDLQDLILQKRVKNFLTN